MKRKSYLLTFMAALLMTACSSDDDAVNGSENTGVAEESGLTFRLSLRNEQGQETTTFKEGENIFFRLTAKYRSTDSKANVTFGLEELFGFTDTFPKQGEFSVSHYANSDNGPTAFAVFSENGQYIGFPMNTVIYNQKSVHSGDSVVLECPWRILELGTREEVFNGIFKKRGDNIQLPPGRYYTCDVTKEEKQGESSYIQHKVYFNVEATPWTEHTKEGAKLLVGRWKCVYKEGKTGDYNEYRQFNEDGSSIKELNVGEANYQCYYTTYSMVNDWTLQYDSQQLSGHVIYHVYSDALEKPNPDFVYDRFSFSSDGRNLTVSPGNAEGAFYIMDPATKYIKVE